jgi:hypothetical protein
MSHVVGNPPANASHVGGIDTTTKYRRVGCKPKFPCKIFKGDNLTHLCPTIIEIQRVWYLYEGPSSHGSSSVSKQPIQ